MDFLGGWAILAWMDIQEPLLVVLGLAFVAYLIGSVNLSIIAGRLLGIPHLSEKGSGNAGATNLLRVAGWHVAIPVLLFDIGKAVGTIWLARFLDLPDLAPLMTLPLLLGNLYPVFHAFKGGKGVAAVVGAFLAIDLRAMLLGGVVFGVVLGINRRVSLGSICMVASYGFWIWLFNGHFNTLVTAVTVAVIITLTHRANIGRLLKGLEPKLGDKPKERP